MSRYAYVVTTSGYGRWDNPHEKSAADLVRYAELDPSIELHDAGMAATGGIGRSTTTWIAWRVSRRHVQAVVDALTYDGFEQVIPWADVDLDEHGVQVCATKDECEDLLDGTSMLAFLGVG